MSKLTHIKTKQQDYYKDEQGLKQGEYKDYYFNGELWERSFFKDGKKHGECKYYHPENGELLGHVFYKNGYTISKKEYNEWQLKEKIETCLN